MSSSASSTSSKISDCTWMGKKTVSPYALSKCLLTLSISRAKAIVSFRSSCSKPTTHDSSIDRIAVPSEVSKVVTGHLDSDLKTESMPSVSISSNSALFPHAMQSLST